MKINHKLFFTVFLIVTFFLISILFVSHDLTEKLTVQKEAKDYENLKQVMKEFFKLQNDKLDLIYDSLKNDSLFLHSILLYEELGYEDQFRNILFRHVEKNKMDIFVYVGRDENQVTNTTYKLSSKEINVLCGNNVGVASFIAKPIKAYLKCTDFYYHNNYMGHLLMGYSYPSFENVLSKAISSKSKIHLSNNDKKYELNHRIEHLNGSTHYFYSLEEFFDHVSGFIELKKDYSTSTLRDETLVSFLMKFFIILFILISCLYFVFWYLVPRKLRRITLLIEGKSRERSISLDGYIRKAKNDEIDEIHIIVSELFNKLDHYEKDRREKELDIQRGQIAQQVAHDIRSPLAALTAVTQGLSELPEDKRIMVRSAVGRINDIANDLAVRGSQSKSGEIQGAESDEVNVEFLTSVIDSLVSEKRLQYRSRLGISIQSALSSRSYGLFAKIQLAQFKRVLSNLVNNAVEALGENGTITVAMKTNANDDICISVADTGKGIAPEHLAKVFERGVTDKKDGQGLGLFHARESVESWSGGIEITSCLMPHNSPVTPPDSPNRPPLTLRGGDQTSGTTVTITLPRQNEPDWFVPELFVYEKMTVIILDDDQSIHQIWQGRFETLKTQIELQHFSNGEALRRWCLDITDGPDGHRGPSLRTIGPMLILCDYEILGSSESGLDVIEELKLQDHTVLVTSRFEEKNLRKRCKNLGIRLLPKNLAGFVPIKLKEISKDLQYVLIDDSRMNRTTWEIMAKRHQKKIITFERPKDFYDVAEKINKDVQLYVDLNLGHGQNGKDVTKKISEQGFQKVYLYTGETSVDASPMPWLAGVVGKGVPFVGGGESQH